MDVKMLEKTGKRSNFNASHALDQESAQKTPKNSFIQNVLNLYF